MDTKVWQNFNCEILESIKNYDKHVPCNDVLTILIECLMRKNSDPSLLGDLGQKFHEFFQSIDLGHPELNCFCANFISQEAIVELESVVELLTICRRKSFDILIPRIKLLFHEFAKNNLPHHGKTLGNPTNTNCHIRFLAQKNHWPARQKKIKQKIYQNRRPSVFTKTPDDVLACYHHNSDKLGELKSELLRKKALFEKLSCSHMVNEIDAAIKKLESEIVTKNFGFRKITLTALAAHYQNLFGGEDVYIVPLDEETANKNVEINKFLQITENFFKNQYSVFDHYGIVSHLDNQFSFLVGERDASTYFIGYIYGQ
jgi:hypothetical protein